MGKRCYATRLQTSNLANELGLFDSSRKFPTTILKLFETRDMLTVVNDQTGAPTGAVLIADATTHCLKKIDSDPTGTFSGTYHLAASGATNWYDYANVLLSEMKKRGKTIKTVKSFLPDGSLWSESLRPKNSVWTRQNFRQLSITACLIGSQE